MVLGAQAWGPFLALFTPALALGSRKVPSHCWEPRSHVPPGPQGTETLIKSAALQSQPCQLLPREAPPRSTSWSPLPPALGICLHPQSLSFLAPPIVSTAPGLAQPIPRGLLLPT